MRALSGGRAAGRSLSNLFAHDPPHFGDMDDLDVGAQPHRPNDDIVIQDIPVGRQCPERGHVEQARDVQLLLEFVGPCIHDR